MKLFKRKFILVKSPYRNPRSWVEVGKPTTDEQGLIARAQQLNRLSDTHMYKVVEAK